VAEAVLEVGEAVDACPEQIAGTIGVNLSWASTYSVLLAGNKRLGNQLRQVFDRLCHR